MNYIDDVCQQSVLLEGGTAYFSHETRSQYSHVVRAHFLQRLEAWLFSLVGETVSRYRNRSEPAGQDRALRYEANHFFLIHGAPGVTGARIATLISEPVSN